MSLILKLKMAFITLKWLAFANKMYLKVVYTPAELQPTALNKEH
jgi:hypothetical protein